MQRRWTRTSLNTLSLLGNCVQSLCGDERNRWPEGTPSCHGICRALKQDEAPKRESPKSIREVLSLVVVQSLLGCIAYVPTHTPWATGVYTHATKFESHEFRVDC